MIKDVSRNGVDIDVSVAASASRVRGDAGLMEVLVRNLLDNAVRYGGPPIRVTVEETAAGIELRVTDSGPGVPEEALPRLFDRFYRVDRARSRRSGGCGLGLAIAKHTIQRHGGEIWAESEGAGRGTTVHVRLPVA